MYTSNYNWVYKRKNEGYFLVNTLRVKVLSIDFATLQDFYLAREGNYDNISDENLKLFIDNGFVYNTKREEKNIIEQQLSIYKESLKDLPLTCFIFLTYDCNLRCSYCCYLGLKRTTSVMSEKHIDNIFKSIKLLIKKKKKKSVRIVISGGEPLLYEHKDIISYYFKALRVFIEEEKINKRKVISSIFTNATNVDSFSSELSKNKKYIDIVYVTLNGPKESHDKYRVDRTGKGSFDLTLNGINKLLELNIPMVTVANIGRGNIKDITELAKIAVKLKWRENPVYQGIYISRIKNHKREDSFAISEAEMLRSIILLVENNEINIGDFNFGDLKLLKSIMNFYKKATDNTTKNNIHQFSGCNNRASQYSFSIDGLIYPCAPSMGICKYSTAKFYPQINIRGIDKNNWLDKGVLSVSQCEECPFAFLCGGGCVFEACEKRGDANIPVCPEVEGIFKLFLYTVENNIRIINDDLLYK